MSDYPVLDLSTDALLTTTRSVRKCVDSTKPVPIGLIRECLEIAVQAPTSANVQNWSFIVVTDVEQRHAIADVYRRTKYDPARNREQRKVCAPRASPPRTTSALPSAVPDGFRSTTCFISTRAERQDV